MLQISSSLICLKLTPTSEESIEEISSNNIVDQASIVDKINTKVSKSGMGFFTPKTRLAFDK